MKSFKTDLFCEDVPSPNQTQEENSEAKSGSLEPSDKK